MATDHPCRLSQRFATCAGSALAAIAIVLATTIATAQTFDLRRKTLTRPDPAVTTRVRPARPANVVRTLPRVPAVTRGTVGVNPRPGYPPATALRRPAAAPPATRPGQLPVAGGRGLSTIPAAHGRGFVRGPTARGPGLAARPGLRQPLGARGLAAPQRGLRPMVRPAMMRPNFMRPAFALPRPTGRFGASPGWAAMRQRFFVPPPISLGPPPGRGIGRTRHEMEYSGVPPSAERRFHASEVVVQIDRQVSRAEVDRLSRQFGVTVVASHSFDAAGRTLYHFRSASGGDVADMVRRLERDNAVAAAQPNYIYTLHQAAPSAAPATGQRVPRAALPPRSATTSPQQPTTAQPVAPPLAGLPPRPLPAGDPTQYAIGKLQLGAVHRLARGRNIRIAVVDSAVDTHHPDLAGAVAESVDPTGQPSRPHAHGTGMAGAIAAHARLLGVAPEASVVAIKVFDERKTSAEATSFQILKGLDEAMRRGVKIINMSFAGPYDVMLERKLRDAYDKGIVLIAAAGNAGPDSPPLYPAADPSVIAVTATDTNNKTFAMANRGAHVALAAPGVDILVPSPGGSYQLTTGTSVAAAHVSGVVALMLEKRPELTPEDVRAVLMGSAIPIPGIRTEDTLGLIDPLKALTYEPPEAAPATANATQSAQPGGTSAATQGAAAPASQSVINQRWPAR